MFDGERTKIEARDADHGDAETMGNRHGRSEADAQPSEEPGSNIDGNTANVGQLDAGLFAHELDLRREVLGMTPIAGRVGRGQNTFMTANGHANL